MNYDLKEALRDYIKLLNQEAYLDAHEALEEAWHPLRLSNHPLKNLVKGLINAAIAFEHLKRNRDNAEHRALKVIASYERHKHLVRYGIVNYELFEEAIQKVETIKKQHTFFKLTMI